MGKNKSGKKKNVFKVAGAKSLKPKTKAKCFAGNLKKIRKTLRENISKIDENLVKLEDDMRRKKEGKSRSSKAAINVEKIAKAVQDAVKLETEKANALNKLKEMSF